jgi:hypothetical protein
VRNLDLDLRLRKELLEYVHHLFMVLKMTVTVAKQTLSAWIGLMNYSLTPALDLHPTHPLVGPHDLDITIVIESETKGAVTVPIVPVAIAAVATTQLGTGMPV